MQINSRYRNSIKKEKNYTHSSLFSLVRLRLISANIDYIYSRPYLLKIYQRDIYLSCIQIQVFCHHH
jgi:hypothetical protein